MNEFLVEIIKNEKRKFSKNFCIKYTNFAKFLQESCKRYSAIVLGTNLAKIAILLQTCKILVRNAKLARISEKFCKICDSCNLG